MQSENKKTKDMSLCVKCKKEKRKTIRVIDSILDLRLCSECTKKSIVDFNCYFCDKVLGKSFGYEYDGDGDHYKACDECIEKYLK